MDSYYNGLAYESLPSENRPVKYAYLGQKTHKYTFIDESVDFEYFMNNECYELSPAIDGVSNDYFYSSSNNDDTICFLDFKD